MLTGLEKPVDRGSERFVRRLWGTLEMYEQASWRRMSAERALSIAFGWRMLGIGGERN